MEVPFERNFRVEGRLGQKACLLYLALWGLMWLWGQACAEEDFFEAWLNRDVTKEERIMLLRLQKADVSLEQA